MGFSKRYIIKGVNRYYICQDVLWYIKLYSQTISAPSPSRMHVWDWFLCNLMISIHLFSAFWSNLTLNNIVGCFLLHLYVGGNIWSLTLSFKTNISEIIRII